MHRKSIAMLLAIMLVVLLFPKYLCYSECEQYQFEARVYPGHDSLRIDLRVYDFFGYANATFYALLLKNPGKSTFNFMRDHRLICLGKLSAKAQSPKAISQTIYDLQYWGKNGLTSYSISFYSDKTELKCLPAMDKQYFTVVDDRQDSATLTAPHDGEVYAAGSFVRVAWNKDSFSANCLLRISLRKVYSANTYDEIVSKDRQCNTGRIEFSVSDLFAQRATCDLLDMLSSDYCYATISFGGQEWRSQGIFSISDPAEQPNFGPRPDD